MNGFTYSAQFESRNTRWRGEVRDPDGRLVVRTSPSFADPREAVDHVTRQHERAAVSFAERYAAAECAAAHCANEPVEDMG